MTVLWMTLSQLFVTVAFVVALVVWGVLAAILVAWVLWGIYATVVIGAIVVREIRKGCRLWRLLRRT